VGGAYLNAGASVLPPKPPQGFPFTVTAQLVNPIVRPLFGQNAQQAGFGGGYGPGGMSGGYGPGGMPGGMPGGSSGYSPEAGGPPTTDPNAPIR
jgi:hypothetical protein